MDKEGWASYRNLGSSSSIDSSDKFDDPLSLSICVVDGVTGGTEGVDSLPLPPMSSSSLSSSPRPPPSLSIGVLVERRRCPGTGSHPRWRSMRGV